MMRSAWVVYGLLVLAALAYCPMLFTGLDQWGRGDWDQFSFRYQSPRVAMLRDAQLPAWNPYVNGGNVLLAHPHCPALSPWYLPTLILGAPLGLRVGVVLFVVIGAVGMAVLLRRWGVSWAGCLLGGVLLMMSAHFAMHITEGHLEWCLLGLMPWVMWCLVRAAEDWRFAILGALILASALLHGSIYIVLVFAPLLVVWAVLESVRTRSWRTAASCAALMGLALLLSAVVVLPRIDFLRRNPRQTELHEQVAPAAVASMLLDPRQAELFRSTRDVRNPPAVELARMLPALSSSLARPYEALRWHRLELEASTTSDWTDIRIEGSPFILVEGPPEQADEIAARLDSLPPSTQGLAIKNPSRDPPVAKQGRATIFTRLPEQGDLRVVVTRGNVGATKLTIKENGRVLLEALHAKPVPNDLSNRLVLSIPRDLLLQDQSAAQQPSGAWYRLQATLRTTADWCNVQVVNCPYLFCVEEPWVEAGNPVRLSATALAVSGRQADAKETALRAILLVQCPEKDDLRLRITQGRLGASTLTLSTLDGKPLPTTHTDTTAPGGEKTREYLLASQVIRQQLAGQPTPWRWRLDELGMNRDWHEYACYVTWLGLAMVVLGVVVSFRRQWPLLATGVVAGLIALGAVVPVDLWALWKLLPMYGSLQVPSRFLVAVVFVMAVCGGYGLDRLGRWTERLGGVWLGRLVQVAIVLAVFAELAALGWNLFGDVFVCPPRPLPAHAGKGFAQRFADDAVRYAAMYSAHYPYLLDNSGVLREYENIAIPRGRIRLVGEPGYRGEAYLEDSQAAAHTAKARIDRWSMSRVRVALAGIEVPNRLVLNQNYFPGWRAIRRSADGTAKSGATQRLDAEPNSDRLVSVAVRPGDQEIEFYYVPGGFVCGAIISLLTLLTCLVVLLAGTRGRWKSWRSTRATAELLLFFGALPRGVLRRVGRAQRDPREALFTRVFGYLAAAAVLNLPFLLCHPYCTLLKDELIRSLCVNVVLFLAPGLPLVGVMMGRRWLPRWGLLWVMAASLAVFIAVLAAVHLAGLPMTAATVWNATWIVTNLAVVLNVVTGGPPAWGLRFEAGRAWIFLLLFAAAYPAFFHAATKVVPLMEDHDFEMQGTGYGLLTRLQPTILTDRDTLYDFAHPTLMHFYTAGSFLYFDQVEHLAVYEAARSRVQQAEGEASVVSPGQQYPTGLRKVELKRLYEHYRQNPHFLETRTPMVFLGAVTVALLGWWIAGMTGHTWLALLVPLAYATSPEVFVRSAIGGYFAISQFALVEILLAVEQWTEGRDRAARMACLLAGGFAALANHKLLLLPAALVAWEMLKLGRTWRPARAAKTLLHPVVVGFVCGTIVFWAYGLSIDPQEFWIDHVRTHLVDRLVHHNPLDYKGYPSVPGLWLELERHTGYVLLPLGIAAMAFLCWPGMATACQDRKAERPSAGWRDTPGLWAVWAVLIAVVFSLVDWRQTKHLMPLLLPLYLAPARWAASGRVPLLLVSVLLCGLLLWNLHVLGALAGNFQAIQPSPDW